MQAKPSVPFFFANDKLGKNVQVKYIEGCLSFVVCSGQAVGKWRYIVGLSTIAFLVVSPRFHQFKGWEFR